MTSHDMLIWWSWWFHPLISKSVEARTCQESSRTRFHLFWRESLHASMEFASLLCNAPAWSVQLEAAAVQCDSPEWRRTWESKTNISMYHIQCVLQSNFASAKWNTLPDCANVVPYEICTTYLWRHGPVLKFPSNYSLGHIAQFLAALSSVPGRILQPSSCFNGFLSSTQPEPELASGVYIQCSLWTGTNSICFPSYPRGKWIAPQMFPQHSMLGRLWRTLPPSPPNTSEANNNCLHPFASNWRELCKKIKDWLKEIRRTT